MFVGTDGDTASEMHTDEVEFLVFLADSLSMLTGNHLLVQGVENRDTREQRVTRVTCHVFHLVHHDRVGDVSFHAVFLGDIVGDETAEVAGVLTIRCGFEVAEHRLVHLINTRCQWVEQTATADDGADTVDVNAFVFQLIENHIFTIRKLVCNLIEFSQIFDRMLDVFLEHLFFVIEDSNFG